MAKKQSADPDQVQPAEGASQTKEAKPQEKEGKPQKPRLPKAPKPAAEHAPTQGTKPATPSAVYGRMPGSFTTEDQRKQLAQLCALFLR